MESIKNWKLVGVAVFSGLLGSLIFNLLFFNAREAIAQNASKESKTITAREFRLVDSKGKTRGVFSYEEDLGSALALFDTKGTRILITVTPDGTPGMVLLDANGKTSWSTDQKSGIK